MITAAISPVLAQRLPGLQAQFPALLSAFDPNLSVDQAIEDEVTRLSHLLAPPFSVSPYLIDANIREVAALLNRLFSFRREIESILAEWISAAISYSTALKQAEAEYQMDLIRWPTAQAEAAAKRMVVIDFVSENEAQHALPGSPLNYNERVQKLLHQMRMDVESAYCRSKALNEGPVYCQYPFITLPFPNIGDLTYAAFPSARFLDAWGGWHRLMSRALEREQALHTTLYHAEYIKRGEAQSDNDFELRPFTVPQRCKILAVAVSARTDISVCQLVGKLLIEAGATPWGKRYRDFHIEVRDISREPAWLEDDSLTNRPLNFFNPMRLSINVSHSEIFTRKPVVLEIIVHFKLLAETELRNAPGNDFGVPTTYSAAEDRSVALKDNEADQIARAYLEKLTAHHLGQKRGQQQIDVVLRRLNLESSPST